MIIVCANLIAAVGVAAAASGISAGFVQAATAGGSGPVVQLHLLSGQERLFFAANSFHAQLQIGL